MPEPRIRYVAVTDDGEYIKWLNDPLANEIDSSLLEQLVNLLIENTRCPSRGQAEEAIKNNDKRLFPGGVHLKRETIHQADLTREEMATLPWVLRNPLRIAAATHPSQELRDMLREMGWNDALAALMMRLEGERWRFNQYLLSPEVEGPTPLTQREPNYIAGVHEAANAFRNGEEMKFRGPREIAYAMEQQFGESLKRSLT